MDVDGIFAAGRAVTADTALRLALYFGMSEAFWMGLQADIDLEEARRKLGKRLETDVRVHAAWGLPEANGRFLGDGCVYSRLETQCR